MSSPFAERVVGIASIAVACLAGTVFVDWLVAQPPNDFRTHQLALFPETIYRMGMGGREALTRATLAVIAAGGLAASALACVLGWKSVANPAARRLSLALSFFSMAVAYFMFVWAHPAYRNLVAWNDSPGTHFVFDLIGYLLLAAALWQLVAFFEIYPRPIAQDDWRKFIEERRDRDVAKARAGWRAHVYSKKPARAPAWAGYSTSLPRLVPWMIAMLFTAALIMAWAEYIPRARDAKAGSGAFVFALMAGPAFSVFLGAVIRSFTLAQFHYVHGRPDDKVRMEWIYSTLLAGGIVALGLPIAGMALFTIWVFTAGESAAASSAHLLFLVPIALALPVFVLSFLASVAMSIFYRGAIDPRLAARRLTVWWLIGVAIAIIFVLIERAVAVRVVHWLGLPPDTGLLLAGVLVAGTIAPVRHSAERSVTSLVSRWLPVEKMMDGERRTIVVAMTDLSGYTALSARDEKQALLHAALLHRNAERTASQNRGRVVKSMGDAVMLEFPDAASAAAALVALHAEFPPAARAIGLDPLPVHSGAHLGEVVVGRDGDLFGQTVNLAARLQGQAEPGQIVVSDSFLTNLGGDRAKHRSLGARRLRNVPEPMECYELASP